MDLSKQCIRYEQKAYKKGWGRGQQESSVLEVKKCRDKVRIAKSEAES